MLKEYLFTPGPTWIPERIFAAMAKPTMHHRTAEFEAEFKKALDGLQQLVGAESHPILLAASGSGAMEAALLNSCKEGDKILVLNAGVFGERWVTIAKKLGLVPVEMKAAAGESVPLEEIERTIKANLDAKAFCVQYAETSTTVLHPVPEIAKLSRKVAPEMLFVVDAVSALATLDIPVNKIGIDILVAGSQKGLMLPPGLSMLWLNSRAWKCVEKNKVRSLYFDLLAERDAHQKNTSAWTPAMNIILGVNESLKMLHEEGLDNVYARHLALSKATRAALLELGFKLLTEKYPAPAVTGAYPPSGVDAEALRKKILKDSGVRVTGGQAALQGKIIRIGHMGYINKFDVITAIAALEMALPADANKKVGSGVQAAFLSFM